MRRLALLAFVVGLLCLGCGGSGGSQAPLETVVLLPVPELSGYVTFPLEVGANTSLRVGDTDANLASRGFCGIDLTALPDGIRVEQALLRLHYGSTAAYPWDDLGDLLADHMDLGTILDPGDYGAGALASAFTVVPHLPVAQEGDLDITDVVRADLEAGRSTTGLRFRFATLTDDDGASDLQFFAGPDSLLGPYPYLTVTFRR